MMVGKVVKDYFAEAAAGCRGKEVLLEVRNYSVADHVEDVSFQVHKGEILALAGVIGSGVHGLLQSLYGVIPKKVGEVFFEGRKVAIAEAQGRHPPGHRLRDRGPQERRHPAGHVGPAQPDPDHHPDA